ncbi:MAG: hypothetical protein LBR31_02330 [Desulfovibrio sp.]|jgi:hypothetical protein|nr:hypothetical protein [Desulfovibrio sp.]
MLNITLTDAARGALRQLQDREEGLSRFRLREFVSGCGVACRGEVRRSLRLVLEECPEKNECPEEDDLTREADGFRFVMEKILLANYGNSFFITLGQDKMPAVAPLSALCENALKKLGTEMR